MRHGNFVKNLLVVGLNVVIFYFLIRWSTEHIQLDLLAQQFARIPLTAVALPVLLNLAAITVYALRLGVLIGRELRISLPTTFLGFGLNSVLPFRLGELAKLYYAKRYFLVPTTNLFAATLVEKLFDLSALAVLAGLIVTLSNISVIHKGIIAALISVVAVGYIAVLGFRRLAHHLERKVGTSVRVRALLAALHQQSLLHHLRWIACYTLVIWVLNTAVVYAGFSSLLPDYRVGILDAAALLLIVALAIAIPTAPAGVGLFEAGIVGYLTQVRAVPNELALAAAVVFHVAVTLPNLLILAWLVVRPQSAPSEEQAPR